MNLKTADDILWHAPLATELFDRGHGVIGIDAHQRLDRRDRFGIFGGEVDAIRGHSRP